MAFNPFGKIDDFGRRRMCEAVARHVGTALATYLLHRGWITDEGGRQIADVAVSLSLYGLTQYIALTDVTHTEKAITVASESSPDLTRKEIDTAAKDR